MLFGQSKTKDSEPFYAIVSGHIYVDERGKKDIEIFTQADTDNAQTEIFQDIDYTLLDFIDIGEKDDYFFVAHVKSWFHSYHDYFDGYQCETESEVTVLNSISDFKEMKLS